MPNTHFWLVRALTNLHAGSGDADYGIVDKHVQRDPVTDLPTINASSIKGAFREALEDHLKDDTKRIFGTENKGGTQTDLLKGEYKFFSAKLLALPVRSSNDFFYIATCPELLQDFLNDADLFGVSLPQALRQKLDQIKQLSPQKGSPLRFGGAASETHLEDWVSVRQNDPSGLETLFGNRFALLHAADFKQLSDELPVIARNHLENGISVNLWYEQVVPRESRFYCPIEATDNILADTFAQKLRSLLQVGANATVGYGLTLFTKLLP